MQGDPKEVSLENKNMYFIIYFLAVPHSLWNLSFPPPPPGIESGPQQ